MRDTAGLGGIKKGEGDGGGMAGRLACRERELQGSRAMRPFVLLCCFVVSSFAASPEGWERTEVEPGGRIDAIADFGGGVVVLGTRLPTPSNVYRSADLGRTWDLVANVGADDYVTCVVAGAGDVGYILTGAKVHLWKTEDDGLTWRDMGRINDSDSGTNFAGTILVADTDADGGAGIAFDGWRCDVDGQCADFAPSNLPPAARR